VPDNDYRGFIKRRVEGLEERVKGGNFLDTNGKILGKHEGYPFYTIGQRKGLGIALGYPAFVTEIRKETNEVIIGRDKDLERDGMMVGQLNLSKYASIEKPLETITKVRYKDDGTPATIFEENGKMKVHFHESVSGVAPGQAAVFYEGNDVVGGGWILKSFKQNAETGIYAAEMVL
jgi:tRNA-uridine 2-sulfurtransferase